LALIQNFTHSYSKNCTDLCERGSNDN